MALNNYPWTVYVSIIEELRDARKTAEIDPYHLGKTLSVPKQTIHRWEAGTARLNMDELAAWADALGMRLTVIDDTGTPLPGPGPDGSYPEEPLPHHMRRLLAEPLKDRREALGFTKRQLAQRVNAPHGTFSRWERASHAPAATDYIQWAHCLGYTLALMLRT